MQTTNLILSHTHHHHPNFNWGVKQCWKLVKCLEATESSHFYSWLIKPIKITWSWCLMWELFPFGQSPIILSSTSTKLWFIFRLWSQQNTVTKENEIKPKRYTFWIWIDSFFSFLYSFWSSQFGESFSSSACGHFVINLGFSKLILSIWLAWIENDGSSLVGIVVGSKTKVLN